MNDQSLNALARQARSNSVGQQKKWYAQPTLFFDAGQVSA